jgi:beta-aspartyl-peptidase (threonine type)
MDLGQARRWAIILHGGAKDIPAGEEQAHREGCLHALAVGVAVLRDGGKALDAVEAVVRELEADPTFNAGRGSVRNEAGEVEMDAAVMDGATLDIGAVAAIRGVRHPVSVASLMLREKPILLVADGAAKFARARSAELCGEEELAAAAGKPGGDTVGCVALDRYGDTAAATSTGGLDGAAAGRVGDSALPGCGLYADSRTGAVVLSGEGESIARTLLAAQVMMRLHDGDPQTAVESAIERIGEVGGEAGAVALDRAGRFGWAHNSTGFAVAYQASDLDRPHTFLRASRRPVRA